MRVKGFYGSTAKIDAWDITMTREFGYHFAVGDPASSKHRIQRTGGYLYEVDLEYSSPTTMTDTGYWGLEEILRSLGRSGEYRGLKMEAAKAARQNFSSLRVQENLIAARVLNEMGIDAVEYENKGEDGGPAVIIWNPDQIVSKKLISGKSGISELKRFIRMIIQ